MGLTRRAGAGRARRLLESGLPGRGLILEVSPTRTTVRTRNGVLQRTCNFRVRVTLDDAAPYEAVCKQRVEEVLISRLKAGASEVQVRANPEDPSEITLDLGHAPPRGL
jgi:hypothetical protein